MLKTALFLLITLMVIPVVAFTMDEPLDPLQRSTLAQLLAVYLVMALLCFVVSSLSNNYSQVDKLWSLIPMAYAWIGRMVPNRYRSHAISRISVVGYAGFFIGPPLMGFLSEGFGLSTSFAVIGGLLFAVTLVLLPVLSRAALRRV